MGNQCNLSSLTVSLNTNFNVQYSISDSDLTVTPYVDLSKLKISTPDGLLTCQTPASTAGNSYVSCNLASVNNDVNGIPKTSVRTSHHVF